MATTNRRDKVQKTELFIAGVERDVKVIQAISQTLNVLQLIHSIALDSQEPKYRLNLISEIDRLNEVLRLMGVADDEMPPEYLFRKVRKDGEPG
jgi:hypothetical protein